MTFLRRGAVLALLALTVLFAGACGDDDGDADEVSSGGAGSGKATKPASPTDFVTTKVSTPPAERGLLTNVTATKDAGHTRIVFEFRDELPGYAVEYTQRPVVQDGSGDEVEIQGDQVLLIRFEPASGFDLEAKRAQPTYTGPKRIAVGGNSDPVWEVVQVSDFEAQLEWAVGLNGKRPFRVLTASDPSALIVDVQALDS